MSEPKESLTWEQVEALPLLHSWEEAVKGKVVRIGKHTAPPKQFVRDGDSRYVWERLIYDPYSSRVYMDDRQAKATIDGVLLFGNQMERRGPTERYDPFEMVWMERLNRIDEAFSQVVKSPNSEALWDGYVFRVGDAWYSDYTTYRTGGEARAFFTAREAAVALEDRSRAYWRTPEEAEKAKTEWLLKEERAAAETLRQRKEAAALEERRRAEDAEIAALEQQLADIERTRYLNELRAKVAQAKENGDV